MSTIKLEDLNPRLVAEIALWQRSGGVADWFTAKLFDLIAKADLQNQKRIELGFPEEVAVYRAWQSGVLKINQPKEA